MRIVIDTNRIIAAMIKDGISRKIIFNENFTFITPDHTIMEINKYEEEIREKTNITHEEFGILNAFIFERIKIIPESEYRDFIEESKRLIVDLDDVPFIAVSLALRADGIWSDDKHFQGQDRIRVCTTENMKMLI